MGHLSPMGPVGPWEPWVPWGSWPLWGLAQQSCSCNLKWNWKPTGQLVSNCFFKLEETKMYRPRHQSKPRTFGHLVYFIIFSLLMKIITCNWNTPVVWKIHNISNMFENIPNHVFKLVPNRIFQTFNVLWGMQVTSYHSGTKVRTGQRGSNLNSNRQ